jgi:hypothetical protein
MPMEGTHTTELLIVLRLLTVDNSQVLPKWILFEVNNLFVILLTNV